MQIEITDANITGTGGSITNATITGDATITPPEVTPPEPVVPVDPGYGIDEDTGWTPPPRPAHPISLPPTSSNPDVIYMLVYCANPPPPHWEWIGFLPGEAPERPTPAPTPPSGEIPTTPGGIKPPPPNGGWGYFPGYGWVYYPGPGGAGPKRK
jgi:hypothetical protein